MNETGQEDNTSTNTTNNNCNKNKLRRAIDVLTEGVSSGDEAIALAKNFIESVSECEPFTGVAIYLSDNHERTEPLLLSGKGFSCPYPNEFSKPIYEPRTASKVYLSCSNNSEYCYFFKHTTLGVDTGGLVVASSRELIFDEIHFFDQASTQIWFSTEQFRVSRTLQSFIDRLQILNSLNHLIAANVGVDKIIKAVVRECAFRFTSDVVIAYVLDEKGQFLEMKGGYGCKREALSPKKDSSKGILSQVINSGAPLIVQKLDEHKNHDYPELVDLGIKSLTASCLEIKGAVLGVLISGYKEETVITKDEITRYSELCHGAGVALSNAKSQEKIKAYTERLEDLVDTRTKDLAIQTEKAQEANRAKSRFLANMSHELRTPLTAIVGYGSILNQGLFGELNDKQKEALGSIIKSSQHLKSLIDDILNLARIESGKEEPEPTRVSLVESLIQVHKLMSQSAIEKSITFHRPEFEDKFKESTLYCDQKHLHQIIINIVSNAIKYTPDNGKVNIEVEDAGDMIKILIKDTGVGISPEKIKMLFERFERGDDSYSRAQEGTGIGLNLTRKLVQINGGKIGVDSVFGQGSCFWIMIPKATEMQSYSSIVVNEDNKKFSRLDGLNVVVVEDNIDTGKLVKLILDESGAGTNLFNNASDALKHLEDKKPDIIITDLAMPGLSGIDLIQQVRGQKMVSKKTPIVVLSACAFEDDRNAASRAGATFFLPKPFRPSEVVSVVRNLTLSAAMLKKGKDE